MKLSKSTRARRYENATRAVEALALGGLFADNLPGKTDTERDMPGGTVKWLNADKGDGLDGLKDGACSSFDQATGRNGKTSAVEFCIT